MRLGMAIESGKGPLAMDFLGEDRVRETFMAAGWKWKEKMRPRS